MYLTNMNLGQYIPTGSFIHRLDPRTKLFSFILIISAIFPSKTVVGVIIWAAALAGIVAASKIPWRAVLQSAKPVMFLVIFTFLFNFGAWYFRTSNVYAALYESLFMSSRLMILMMFAVMLPLTTSPLELADGLNELLRPLERFRFPANECAIMIAMALRFIPLLMQETDKIIRAQLSRGARLDQGNIFRRAKAFFPVLIPLIIIIFRRADDIAVAMEARGYDGGKGRTRRRPLIWRWRDTLAVAGTAAGVALFLALGL
ncbi:MAG: energy-coupling factor transporter transmembrane protein EcfT [Synergistaceae bacterium]|nr:energy-coupling factor transporter transmembrane protein EcfT [Synergistaceae bacterium]